MPRTARASTTRGHTPRSPAQRFGTITLRTDDGEEHAIAVAAGDTAKTVAEAVAMLLTMSARDRA